MELPDESREPWYQEAFKAAYRRVYPHRDLEAARGEVDWLLHRGIRGPVLDLACGFGRHVLALAEAGFEVAGLDLSMDLLAEARTLPGHRRFVDGRLVRGDARALPFAPAAFESVVLLFSSFGYLGEAGDERVLAEISRVLGPGGRVWLDLMNPARVRAELSPRTERREEGWSLLEERRLMDAGRTVVKDVTLSLPEGETRRWREKVRMYEEGEIRALLLAQGLGVESLFGDFAGEPFGPGSPRMLVEARKGRASFA